MLEVIIVKKRRIIIFCFFLFILFFLKANENTEKSQSSNHIVTTSDINKILTYEDYIVKIVVTATNEKHNIIVNDEASLESFGHIFSTASRRDGIANMIQPEYILNVVYEESEDEHIYLWLGNEGERSVLMNQDDTHSTYIVLPEMTSHLNKMIKILID